MIVGEHREPVVVETRLVVGDIAPENEVIDANRLMPRGVPAGQQKLDTAIAEEIVIAIDQDDLTWP